MGTTGATILVVEDDPDVRAVLSDLLKSEAYTVVLAEDGTKALSLAHGRRPDLILLDLNMPRMDGEAFCHTYREQGGTAPVILLTAANPRAVAAAVEACGAVGFIPKPFDLDDALDTIAHHLSPDARRAGVPA